MRESQLLKHIYGFNDGLPESVVIGPGDDMGAVHVAGADVLVTVDQVADGVHFDLGRDPLELVGRKAMTRNLSDVAAMAALPVGAVVAACLPRAFTDAQASQLFDAIRRTGMQYGCPVFGGDIAVWDQKLLVSVTVLAHGAGITPVRRSGARPGDAVYVTGRLGGSFSSGRHLTFEPRLELARTLARKYDLHCMIDLSDGLGRDLGHLCAAANLGAVVEESALPIAAGDWTNALGDGEDYELCFTVAPNVRVTEATRVGAMVEGSGVSVRLRDGSLRDGRDLGWEHHG